MYVARVRRGARLGAAGLVLAVSLVACSDGGCPTGTLRGPDSGEPDVFDSGSPGGDRRTVPDTDADASDATDDGNAVSDVVEAGQPSPPDAADGMATCGTDGGCDTPGCDKDSCAGPPCGDVSGGSTRTLKCGYKKRGTVTQKCVGGTWSTTKPCTGVWFRSCRELQAARRSVTSGMYTLDPGGPGTGASPFDVRCDMTTRLGGWTLVATFRNDDKQRWSGAQSPDYWRNKMTIGALSKATSGDFKSKAFWEVPADDLLLTDDAGNWMVFENAVTGSTLYDTLQSFNSCQTSPMSNVTIDSNVAVARNHGFFTFYGADPNESDTCTFNYNDADDNDSAVVTAGGSGCDSKGVGLLVGDFDFCLQGNPNSGPVGNCSDWYGYDTLAFGGGCAYAQLWVR